MIRLVNNKTLAFSVYDKFNSCLVTYFKRRIRQSAFKTKDALICCVVRTRSVQDWQNISHIKT